MLSCELEKNRHDVLLSIEEKELSIFDVEYFHRPPLSKHYLVNTFIQSSLVP
jgi:hypothetical protein